MTDYAMPRTENDVFCYCTCTGPMGLPFKILIFPYAACVFFPTDTNFSLRNQNPIFPYEAMFSPQKSTFFPFIDRY